MSTAAVAFLVCLPIGVLVGVQLVRRLDRRRYWRDFDRRIKAALDRAERRRREP